MEQSIFCMEKQIGRLLDTGRQILVAIDGNCAAGKTTLAAALKEKYDCNVFHMDDFFLRPEQRTPERYAQPGGNVDYERFREAVLMPLREGRAFSYRPFSCRTLTLLDPVQVAPKQLNIVEGTYSQHPYYGDIYDLKVFWAVEAQVQRERILRRPPWLHRQFFEVWIPMETVYFDRFQIREQSGLVLQAAGDGAE